MRPTPRAERSEICSPSSSAASRTVMTRLDLSTEATPAAGPICSARKYASHDTPVPMPDNTSQRDALDESVPICRNSPRKATIAQAKTRTTHVRMAVARFEDTPAMPILAAIVVKAAATAEMSAYIHHVMALSSV